MVPIFPGSMMPKFGHRSKAEKQFEQQMNGLVTELDDILASLEENPSNKALTQNYQLTSVIDQLLDVALDFSNIYEQELKNNVIRMFH